MILAAFMACIALVWLILCFGLYIKEVLRAFRHKKNIISNAAYGLKTVFTSMWGHDFFGSLILLFISATVLPGVTGMLTGLFASGIFSIIMGVLHFDRKNGKKGAKWAHQNSYSV